MNKSFLKVIGNLNSESQPFYIFYTEIYLSFGCSSLLDHQQRLSPGMSQTNINIM